MTKPNQRDIGAMRVPHRRDISARQDLLGRELRQLFDDYTQEEMPDELARLALQLQSAFETRPAGADVKSAAPTPAASTPVASTPAPAVGRVGGAADGGAGVGAPEEPGAAGAGDASGASPATVTAKTDRKTDPGTAR